ncbi:Large cysteine-rich periplasmic protein OmcB precursor [Botrimarina colliarenosi]|uniref:Large cysteine-rich periplasmic protein OmcB n=1 Tax=Botrimarina colliarenosi TaxID=2528001 RepID=A0A5C6AJX8_9BACT|nr:CARDB domain-containing protein [Botrimarina colliarenosi]TWT99716.1 Large cysteine-rich periplasmic protein OmcB precursor [Botrimarina colliarenosi]
MKRLPECLLIVLFVACGADALAQGSAASAAGGDLYPAMATDQRSSLPRINPRELLPRNWFGSAGSEPAIPKPAPANSQAPKVAASGSAQSRLLRDIQRTEGLPVASDYEGRRPPARAGSALSTDAPASGAEAATAASTNARLARSIAAEAASALAATPAPRRAPLADDDIAPLVAGTNLLPYGDAAEPAPLLNEASAPAADGVTPIEAESPASDAVEAPTVEAPVASNAPRVVESPFAESDSGRVSVASKPSNPTKLPLFIGNRYSTTTSTVGAKEPKSDANLAAGPLSAGAAPTPSAAAAKPEPVEDDLLLTQRMPVLVSKVAGPRTITVGREATYRVLLANRGDIAADQVVTQISVPDGAEVVGAQSADGVVDLTGSAEPGVFTWRANRLAAGAVIKLDLQLIARTGEPIELGVNHSHQPLNGHTMVEVQEPKLALAIVGPDEVLYGKPQLFRLTISNPGTGSAENVTLHLTPPGGDTTRQTSHEFGLIGAGDDRTVEIELTAREAGQLAVNATADADGDVSAQLTKEVFCRKPELAIDWRGPADRYAGAPSVYYFRVRNPGTAPAPDVVLDVELPAGFEVLADEATPGVKNGRLAYRLGALPAGEERVFELHGVMRQAGENTFVLSAAGADETRSEPVTALTEVIALADLKLDVLDPKGPIATDQEVTYEVRITNRGSCDAHDVRVVGLFSEGIEPHHVDGSVSDIKDGRVDFATIDRLSAGEQLVFKIHARAYEEGTHLFRAEVLCRDLDIKLAAEETTRFFLDEAINVARDGYSNGPASPLFPR